MLISEENGENTERENAKKLVFDACADVKELRSGLESGEKPTLIDDLYMKKKLREATVKAQSESLEEVTVAILIGVILNDPPKRIKHLIEVKPVSEEKSADNRAVENGKVDIFSDISEKLRKKSPDKHQSYNI